MPAAAPAIPYATLVPAPVSSAREEAGAPNQTRSAAQILRTFIGPISAVELCRLRGAGYGVEGCPPRSSQPQIRCANLRVRAQVPGAALHLHLARFDHIAAGGDLQRRGQVLLHEQDGHPLPVERADGLEHLIDDDGGKPE